MRWLGRSLVVAGVAVAGSLAGAAPAAADPARPGNVRSEVLAVVPTVDGVEVAVVGGDAFVRLTVARGVEAAVPGYQGEPYLRFLADGTVEENQASEAVYLNRNRLPLAKVPDGVGPDAAPVWKQVATGGSYLWHDHRVHWMGGGRPPQAVTAWEVPLTVAGQPVVVQGQYVRVVAPAAWPWWLLAALVAGGLGWWARRQVGRAGLVAAGAGLAGLPVAWSLARGPGATGLSVWAGPGLLAVAVVSGVVGAVLARRPERRPFAGALVVGAGAALLLWSLRRLSVWSSAVLVSDLPAWWDRGATALAVGVGVAAVAVGGLALLGPVPAAPPARQMAA